jgi:hypothetical protein
MLNATALGHGAPKNISGIIHAMMGADFFGVPTQALTLALGPVLEWIPWHQPEPGVRYGALQLFEGHLGPRESHRCRLRRETDGSLDSLHPVEGSLNGDAACTAVHALDRVDLDAPAGHGRVTASRVGILHVFALASEA